MKIGVTGTREGANERQLKEVLDFMIGLGTGHELHHGDCKGVDEQVAIIAKELGWHVVCHPPVKNELRAYHQSDVFREAKGYLVRDRNIVDETEFLMVVPLHDKWQPKGGTWYTHDYAVKQKKPLRVFYPR
jgi:hypothetical protein